MIKVQQLPLDLQIRYLLGFERVNALQPEGGNSSVLVYNRDTDTHIPTEIFRKYKCYLNTPTFDPNVKKSFMFLDNVEQFVPDILVDLWEYAKRVDSAFNQITVNWYSTGEDFIQMHSDCTSNMIDGAQIMIINLTDTQDTDRELIITNKLNVIENRIPLNHGKVIIMDTDDQLRTRHGVGPSRNKADRRISVTFRQMKT